MVPVTLETLHKGLQKLAQSNKTRQNELCERLKKGEKLAEAEEEWMNNNGSALDAVQVVESLKDVPDLEQAISWLSEGNKAIIKTLENLAKTQPQPELAQKTSVKWKHGLDIEPIIA